MSLKISIIIPTLDEAQMIPGTLVALQPLRLSGHEVIVVDGGSNDGTDRTAQPLSDQFIRSPRGRARQLNAGARIAKGDVLLFLHADTLLPESADLLILDGLRTSHRNWGHFDVKLSGQHPLLRLVESLMNCRSRLTRICTGDQGIFLKKDLFERVGGFPEIELMEDIELSRILKAHGPPLCLRQRVVTSSRRWEQNGILHTVLLMWHLRLAYALGADPARLARFYGTEE